MKASKGANDKAKSAASSAPERKTSKRQKTLKTDQGGAPQEDSKPAPKGILIEDKRQSVPTKNKDGQLVFEDAPDFRPNLTPSEVLQLGSFGGTYFRPIKSAVTGQSYRNVHQEFPDEWFEGLNMGKQVTSSTYDLNVNRYKVKCGTDLCDWEKAGWIADCDPYGWFQWYCRFYSGRRCSDDARQLGRASRCFGKTGRWRTNLLNKIIAKNATFDDVEVSPVVRQTLQHWGYVLTEKDFHGYCKRKGMK